MYHLVDRWTDLNVEQARKLADAAPQSITTGMPKAQAEAIKIELEALGAIVQVSPHATAR